MDNKLKEAIKILGISKVFGYSSGIIYLVGFLLAIKEHYIAFMLLVFVAIVCYITSIIFDIRFITKALKDEHKRK